MYKCSRDCAKMHIYLYFTTGPSKLKQVRDQNLFPLATATQKCAISFINACVCHVYASQKIFTSGTIQNLDLLCFFSWFFSFPNNSPAFSISANCILNRNNSVCESSGSSSSSSSSSLLLPLLLPLLPLFLSSPFFSYFFFRNLAK